MKRQLMVEDNEAAEPSNPTWKQVVQLEPSEIFEDAERFQSRAAYPRDYRESDLDDVNAYNPLFAGVISVWRDPDDERIYVVKGHRRLRLAKRVRAPWVRARFLSALTDADAFAAGVELGIADWAGEGGDKMLWAIESRRAAVDRALHTRWLDPDSEPARRLYQYYPDLGRRYSESPEDYEGK